MSNKKSIMISVDYSTWLKHKEIGSNVSKICDNALHLALDGKKIIKKAQSVLVEAKEEAKAIEQGKKEHSELVADMGRLRLARKDFIASPGAYSHKNQQFSAGVDAICAKHNLTRSEVMKMLDKGA